MAKFMHRKEFAPLDGLIEGDNVAGTPRPFICIYSHFSAGT